MHSTSITLLQRVRSTTDAAAWNRFVALYAPLLAHWAARAGLSESDVADVVQDVLLTLLKELPGFEYDANRRNFRGWLKTITVNKVRDRQRKAQPEAHDPALDLHAAPDPALDELWDAEYRQHVTRQALRIMATDFEPQTWRACWETTVESRPAREVATELGMTEAAVYVAKSRVLRRLREELAELLD